MLRSTPVQTPIKAIDWNPVDQSLLAASFDRIHGWDADGQARFAVKTSYYLDDIDWHPDGDRFVEVSDRLVRIRDAQGGLIREFDATHFHPAQAKWLPDGASLAILMGDGRVVIFSEAGEPLRTLGSAEQPLQGFAIHPDGEQIATFARGGKEVRVERWREASEPRIIAASETESIWHVAWNADGSLLAVALGKITPPSTSIRPMASSGCRPKSSAPDAALSWSPIADRVAAVNDFGYLYLFSAEQDQPLPLWRIPSHLSNPSCVAWSREGRFIATGASDGTIRFWDADKGAPDRSYIVLTDGASATFSAAGQILDGDPEVIERELVYLVEAEGRERFVLGPRQFNAFIASARPFSEWWETESRRLRE